MDRAKYATELLERLEKRRSWYIKERRRMESKSPPFGTKSLSDEEFIQWFEQKLAESPTVTITPVRGKAMEWHKEGTSITGPAWLLVASLPSTEGTKQEIGRWKRITGGTNPFEEALNGTD